MRWGELSRWSFSRDILVGILPRQEKETSLLLDDIPSREGLCNELAYGGAILILKKEGGKKRRDGALSNGYRQRAFPALMSGIRRSIPHR